MTATESTRRPIRLESALSDSTNSDNKNPIALTRSQDGWATWQLIYARAMIQRLLARIEPLGARSNWQVPLLVEMLETIGDELKGDIAKGTVDRRCNDWIPWLDLLCAAVPKWMTISRLAQRIPAIMAEGQRVTGEDLELGDASGRSRPLNLRQVREDAEKGAIAEALALCDQRVVQAADLLGVSRPTLYALMEKYGLK